LSEGPGWSETWTRSYSCLFGCGHRRLQRDAHCIEGGDGESADKGTYRAAQQTLGERLEAHLTDDLGLRPSDRLESSELVGDSVVELGYPLGLGTTATQGIVSGLDRAIQVADGPFDATELSGLLQTDAAINPGNSGGALLDSDGRLIGINTAAASASSAENIGFAVAIDEAFPIIEQLVDRA
jgi:Trypsin-like peptidase domain